MIEIKCRRKSFINEEERLYLVKFFNNKLIKFWFKVPKSTSNNFKDVKTKRAIKKGKNVTIKLPYKFPYKRKEWRNDAWIFLAEL